MKRKVKSKGAHTGMALLHPAPAASTSGLPCIWPLWVRSDHSCRSAVLALSQLICAGWSMKVEMNTMIVTDALMMASRHGEYFLAAQNRENQPQVYRTRNAARADRLSSNGKWD